MNESGDLRLSERGVAAKGMLRHKGNVMLENAGTQMVSFENEKKKRILLLVKSEKRFFPNLLRNSDDRAWRLHVSNAPCKKEPQERTEEEWLIAAYVFIFEKAPSRGLTFRLRRSKTLLAVACLGQSVFLLTSFAAYWFLVAHFWFVRSHQAVLVQYYLGMVIV